MHLALVLAAALALQVAPKQDADAGAAPTLTFRPGARYSRGALGRHGAVVWTVVIAAEAQGSGALVALHQSGVALHLAMQLSDATCAEPVGSEYPASVPHGPTAQLLAVQFRTEREARGFAAAMVEPALWIGRVRVLCAD